MRSLALALTLLVTLVSHAVAGDTANEDHTRYLGMMSFGLLANAVVDGNGSSVFTLRTVHGVQMHGSVSLGAGIGYERFVDITLIPLFVDIRGYIPAWTVDPYLVFEGGVSATTGRHGSITSGGPLLRVGGGIKFPMNEKTAFLVELGVEHQATVEDLGTFVIDPGTGFGVFSTRHLDVSYDLFEATLGISF